MNKFTLCGVGLLFYNLAYASPVHPCYEGILPADPSAQISFAVTSTRSGYAHALNFLGSSLVEETDPSGASSETKTYFRTSTGVLPFDLNKIVGYSGQLFLSRRLVPTGTFGRCLAIEYATLGNRVYDVWIRDDGRASLFWSYDSFDPHGHGTSNLFRYADKMYFLGGNLDCYGQLGPYSERCFARLYMSDGAANNPIANVMIWNDTNVDTSLGFSGGLFLVDAGQDLPASSSVIPMSPRGSVSFDPRTGLWQNR
jgi:hypothetical protein